MDYNPESSSATAKARPLLRNKDIASMQHSKEKIQKYLG